MKRFCWIAIVGLSISLAAAAQEDSSLLQAKKELNAQMEKMAVEAKVMGPGNMMLTAPVTGAPYSADEVTGFTQTLADGTHIQREDKVTVYRDSQGRVRRETPTAITISDPVAGVAYSLDPVKLTARKMMVMKKDVAFTYQTGPGSKQQEGPVTVGGTIVTGADAEKVTATRKMTVSMAGAGGGASTFVFINGDGDSKVSAGTESLGTRSVEGVLSEGTSASETIPAGSIGNDKAIQVVSERWYSSELKTVTMTKRSDPRTGEETFRLTNIHRVEPSPDLFQLPAGYQLTGGGTVGIN